MAKVLIIPLSKRERDLGPEEAEQEILENLKYHDIVAEEDGEGDANFVFLYTKEERLHARLLKKLLESNPDFETEVNEELSIVEQGVQVIMANANACGIREFFTEMEWQVVSEEVMA
jgi:hypothetical protein